MNIKEDYSIVMAKDNYGQGITFKITSSILDPTDIIRIKINTLEKETVITKEYTELEKNEENKYIINFFLTEEESKLLDIGYYVWGFEHERNGVILNDLLLNDRFIHEFEVKVGI